MSDNRRFVIVGASLAGAKAAEELRAAGFEGAVTLVGEEAVRPYERPPLSKQILRGEKERPEHPLYIHDEGFYSAHDIDLRLSERAVGLAVGDREVTLRSGEKLRYDAVLLTTGAGPRHLRIEGSDLDGVHYLRRLSDAQRLHDAIKAASRVAVIGAGWIGCEVAASARQMGAEVAMVELGQLPLERVLGATVAQFFRDVHADEGVELHLGVGVKALRGQARVEQVVLADGTVIDADVVVVGVGVKPRTELAEGTRIGVANGITTDEHLATDVPGVFAAGDVANRFSPWLGGQLRVEHWASALSEAPVAARNMLGHAEVYDAIPFFFSDQYDVGIEYYGYASVADQVVVRGDLASRKFMAFWLHEGVLAAAMHSNTWGTAATLEALVTAKPHIDPKLLADPGVDLAGLVPAADAAGT